LVVEDEAVVTVNGAAETANAPMQAVGAGLFAAVVGYCSSVAVVIHGLSAIGASEAEITSALVAVSVLMGASGILLSLGLRMPISVAWSTPGMALLSSMTALPGGFAAATGAFVVVGALIVVAGLWAPLGRAASAIPRPIANGMLAGILLKLCLAPFVAIGSVGLPALAVVVVWLAVGRFRRLWAAPASLAVALAMIAFQTDVDLPDRLLPSLAFVTPDFEWQALISIALPLFVVTMASQNIPGFAVLASFGYRPPPRPIFLLTGAASSVAALFGGPTINLAAITAALCSGPDAHPDPARRWLAAVVNGTAYGVFAFFATIATLLVTRSSPALIEAVAGLALIGAMATAMLAAVQEEDDRLPAIATFLVTASGLTLFGIGSAFWGLVAGLIVLTVYRGTTNSSSSERQ
jgi:benzoate membrane transport protein